MATNQAYQSASETAGAVPPNTPNTPAARFYQRLARRFPVPAAYLALVSPAFDRLTARRPSPSDTRQLMLRAMTDAELAALWRWWQAHWYSAGRTFTCADGLDEAFWRTWERRAVELEITRRIRAERHDRRRRHVYPDDLRAWITAPLADEARS